MVHLSPAPGNSATEDVRAVAAVYAARAFAAASPDGWPAPCRAGLVQAARHADEDDREDTALGARRAA